MQLPFSHGTLWASAPVSRCEIATRELSMPDLDQIKQGERGARDGRGRFPKGRSANPDGHGPAASEAQDRLRGDAFKPSHPINRASHHAI
jgi:hypothetical protein